MNRLNRLNFSGGPGALPDSVLEQVREAIDSVPGVGLSILGISHRSDWFAEVVHRAEANFRRLLGLSERFHVLFLQGGATQQFSMVPMALLAPGGPPARYVRTGYWSNKPIEEARRVGPVELAWSHEAGPLRRLPADAELVVPAETAYLHYVSNETVEGLQFHRTLGPEGVPRVCDMSSDLLSRPCEADRFALIYAHAQKNIGPSGVTIVIVRDDVLAPAYPQLPGFLDYRTQIQAHSNFNTPPVFSIYVTLLSTQWLLDEVGGLRAMAALNTAKAGLIYAMLDARPDFYIGRAARADRSMTNVCFELPTPALEAAFIAEAGAAGFSGLAGHRSIGGIRASLYNGLSLWAAEELANFMLHFQKTHGGARPTPARTVPLRLVGAASAPRSIAAVEP